MLNLALWQERWAESLKLGGRSPRTLEAYTHELKPLFDFLGSWQIRSLAEVTRAHLEGYRHYLFEHEPPLKLSTQSHRLTAVKSFFVFLYRQEYLATNPANQLASIRVPRQYLRPILSEEEVTRLIESLPAESVLGLRDRAILEVLYSTGIRNSELRGLKLTDLDVARSQIRVLHGKGGRSRVLPLGQQALEWTLRYIEHSRPRLLSHANDDGTLFLSQRHKKMDREALTDIVVRAGELAGIDRRVTPHMLRHSVATQMLARQAGIRHIQQLLGHQSLDSTQVYARVDISQLQRMHQRFHPREHQ